MLLGLAIGDSLGNSSEGMPPGKRRALHGEIRDYRPNPYLGNRRVGTPSDDTQMAFWTIEQLLEDGKLVPAGLAARFASNRIFGMGRTVRQFLRNYNKERLPWEQAGVVSAGNGSFMRVAPVILPHLYHPDLGPWEDAATAGRITHNDPSAIGSCVALVGVLCELLWMERAPAPEWWLDRFIDRRRPIEGNVQLKSRVPGSAYMGPIWKLIDTEVRAALLDDLPTLAACERWYSGAFLLETVPSVLYILARHAGDPEEAMVRAANDTWDNDTCAAVVGAAVGALHGASALPERWRVGLLGRTRADDDGHVQKLTDLAVERFVLSGP
jgi:ADP-ribosylglycohydrolase